MQLGHFMTGCPGRQPIQEVEDSQPQNNAYNVAILLPRTHKILHTGMQQPCYQLVG